MTTFFSARDSNPLRLTLRDIASVLARRLPKHTVTVEPSQSNTDRKLAGTRLIHRGKGRRGLRLRVVDPIGRVLLDHDSSETYRYNGEVIREAERLWGIRNWRLP